LQEIRANHDSDRVKGGIMLRGLEELGGKIRGDARGGVLPFMQLPLEDEAQPGTNFGEHHVPAYVDSMKHSKTPSRRTFTKVVIEGTGKTMNYSTNPTTPGYKLGKAGFVAAGVITFIGAASGGEGAAVIVPALMAFAMIFVGGSFLYNLWKRL
jgi:hypothetical protein